MPDLIGTRRTILLIAIFIIFLPISFAPLTASLSQAGTVDLPRTGQTTSFAPADDGAIQAGVPWPTPRFTDNGNGAITDNLTGLMWLKDANCIKSHYPSFDVVIDRTGRVERTVVDGDGKVTWQKALDFVAGINAGTYSNCGAGHNDWRLPNVNELESLVNAEEANPAAWLNTQGFTNVQDWTDVQDWWYWSSSTYASDTGGAWSVSMKYGNVFVYNKSFNFHVWPVRAGQAGLLGNSVISAAPVWKTGQITSYAPGDDGAIQAGVPWPEPRFTDNGDGTATDNLTGLMWLKDAKCFGSKTWLNALNTIADFNPNPGMHGCLNYTAGYTDWRLPNRKELHSPTDFSRYNPPLPSGHPFTDVQAGEYWSSTTSYAGTRYAWFVGMANGSVDGRDVKDHTYYVWPVRAGRLFGSSVISPAGTTTTTPPPVTTTSSTTSSTTSTTSSTTTSIPITTTTISTTITTTTIPTTTITTPPPPPEVKKGIAKAIIVAGGGPHPSNTLWRFTDEFSFYMYKLFKKRGLTDDDIYYMNPVMKSHDIDGDSRPDLIEDSDDISHKGLERAFEWAKTQVSDEIPLYFYINTHGGKDTLALLYLNTGEILNASELKTLFDKLPHAAKKVIMIEACYSGSFLDDLTGPNRIIVTSSDGESQSYSVEGRSFTKEIGFYLLSGRSLLESFRDAKSAIEGDFRTFRGQSPQLDDDGDGMYTPVDGLLASKTYIGGAGISAASPPSITASSSAINLPKGTSSTGFWVKATSLEGEVKEVYAVIQPPSFVGKDSQEGKTEIAGLSRIGLSYNKEQDRWIGYYDGFTEKGTYRLFITGLDKTGLESIPYELQISSEGVEAPKTPFSIELILNKLTLKAGDKLTIQRKIKGVGKVDTYLAVVLPDGMFFTFAYPDKLSWPNQMPPIPWRVGEELEKERSEILMALTIPEGMPTGRYGIAVGASWGKVNWKDDPSTWPLVLDYKEIVVE